MCYDEELVKRCFGSVFCISFDISLCLTGFGIVRYDRDASRYHKGVYGRKHRDLIAALDATEI